MALVTNFILRDRDYHLDGAWQAVLAVPTVWLVVDAVADTDDSPFIAAMLVGSLAVLPFGIYVLARLMAGDYFRLTPRLRVGIVVIAVGMTAVGWGVGREHPRFLTCDDFARAGEFVPDDCRDD